MGSIKFPPLIEVLRRRLQADFDPTLSDTIVPVIVLEADRPEYLYLQGARLCAGFQQAPTVTNSADWVHVGLENPTGSNVLITVNHAWSRVRYDDIGAGNRPSQPRLLRAGAGDLSDLNLVAMMLDFRWDANTAGNLRPQGRIMTEQNAAEQGSLICDFRGISEVGDTTSGDFAIFADLPRGAELVIPPGEMAICSVQGRNTGAAAAVRLSCSWLWTERPMSSWETSPVPGG